MTTLTVSFTSKMDTNIGLLMVNTGSMKLETSIISVNKVASKNKEKI